jgi:hypothetical protein
VLLVSAEFTDNNDQGRFDDAFWDRVYTDRFDEIHAGVVSEVEDTRNNVYLTQETADAISRYTDENTSFTQVCNDLIQLAAVVEEKLHPAKRVELEDTATKVRRPFTFIDELPQVDPDDTLVEARFAEGGLDFVKKLDFAVIPETVGTIKKFSDKYQCLPDVAVNALICRGDDLLRQVYETSEEGSLIVFCDQADNVRRLSVRTPNSVRPQN